MRSANVAMLVLTIALVGCFEPCKIPLEPQPAMHDWTWPNGLHDLAALRDGLEARDWIVRPLRAGASEHATLLDANKTVADQLFNLTAISSEGRTLVSLTASRQVLDMASSVDALAPVMEELNETLLQRLGPSPYAPVYHGGFDPCSRI